MHGPYKSECERLGDLISYFLRSLLRQPVWRHLTLSAVVLQDFIPCWQRRNDSFTYDGQASRYYGEAYGVFQVRTTRQRNC